MTSQNTVAMSAAGSTLTFNTTTVNVDPAAYTGRYSFNQKDNAFASGARSVVLMPGLNNYLIDIENAVSLRFNVDAAGVVTSQNTVAMSAAGSTLTFNTTTVNVDPAAYTGRYSFNQKDNAFASGARSVVLMPGLNNYLIDIENAVSLRFNVDAAGVVTSQNTVAMSAAGATLTFNTTTVNVDPNGYSGTYSFNQKDPVFASGVRDVILMPGLSNYIIDIRHGLNARFSVDADGNPDPSILPITIDGVTYNFLLSAFTLTTVDIDIKPSGGGNEVEPNEPPDPWNANSKGKVPVAVLTTDIFDAADVDITSVFFGKTGTEAAPVKDELKDVDGDGDDDLLLKFEVQDAMIECNDPLATLTGQTIFGADFEGTEPIRTVGCE